MEEAAFHKIKYRAEQFRHTSMLYTDYDEIKQYDLLLDNESLLLLYGYNKGRGFFEFHWAANESNDLLTALDKKNKNVLVSFVPQEWVDDFLQFGFRTYAVFHDYFHPDIRNIDEVTIPEFLTEKDCEAASEVTKSCYEQSRGFHGETAEWMKSWINNEEPAALESEAKHCAVIIHRENGIIVGIVCTCVYAYGSEKGPVAWIREVAVHPEYQRRGIAGKLILQALTYGKNHGAVRAFLAADECNSPAIHLYEKLGFIASKEESQIDMLYSIDSVI